MGGFIYLRLDVTFTADQRCYGRLQITVTVGPHLLRVVKNVTLPLYVELPFQTLPYPVYLPQFPDVTVRLRLICPSYLVDCYMPVTVVTVWCDSRCPFIYRWLPRSRYTTL